MVSIIEAEEKMIALTDRLKNSDVKLKTISGEYNMCQNLGLICIHTSQSNYYFTLINYVFSQSFTS